jgi:hypothetical protein
VCRVRCRIHIASLHWSTQFFAACVNFALSCSSRASV